MVKTQAVNRIDAVFNRLRLEKEKALIAYVMAGDPDLEKTEEIVLALEKGGADLVELGVPFTDPLADGPVIQKAAVRALKNGANLEKIFSAVKRLRQKTEMPVILMSYYNPILQYGEEKFVLQAHESGVDGVIIPDLPAGESDLWVKAARKSGLKTIFLLAPTSSQDRIKKVAETSTGFIYYVALTGITGAPLEISHDIKKKIKEIRKKTGLPIAVGFGISTPAQAYEISRSADGIIVGSAIVKRIEESDPVSLFSSLVSFIHSLKQALL